MIRVLLVAKDWAGGLARYLSIAMNQREDLRPLWIRTYPSTLLEKLIYRTQRQDWRDKLLKTINHTPRDIAVFINLPVNAQHLEYHSGNILWLTDAPSYEAPFYNAFSRIYVSDPGYAGDVKEVVGSDKFAGVLPFACEPSVHVPKLSQTNTDVCFIGNRDIKRDAYLEQLLISDCSCHIYGNYFAQHSMFWKNPTSFRPSIANSALAQTYARYRISLNIHARVVREGTNMRTFECAACDIAQLVEYRPGIEDLFIPDEEICLFQTPEELSFGLAKLLADEKFRNSLGRKARDRVLAEHTYSHRLNTVLAEF